MAASKIESAHRRDVNTYYSSPPRISKQTTLHERVFMQGLMDESLPIVCREMRIFSISQFTNGIRDGS